MCAFELPPSLAERVRAAGRAVVFTGAGVSKESGLATFRDADGLWSRTRPEDLATPEAFRRQPDLVWRWYGERFRRAAAAGPNPAHRAIARLERVFPSLVVVTQNVDGLHRRAGSRDILELHGTLAAARCQRCGEEMEMEMASRRSPDHPPRHGCGGLFRPAVVWFGEPLPQEALARAFREAERCDLLLSVGTSAQVYPAAGVLEIAHRAGAALVEVNPEPTPFSARAHLRIAAPAGEALPALVEAFAACRR
jgi:NAD-dependent deacetylase